MSTIVVGEIPVEEFALERTFERVPDVEFEGERVVETGNGVSMPIVWARASDLDRTALDRALDDDESVGDFSVLASFDGEWLYRIEWVKRAAVVITVLLSGEGTILATHGNATRWRFRVFYPRREGFSTTNERFEDHGIEFEVLRVRDIEGEPTGRFGLTEEQHRAVMTAWEMGYFAVPREAQLADVAEALDISHQALSERLRRGHANLVEATLSISAP